jgi:hypothetical protein
VLYASDGAQERQPECQNPKLKGQERSTRWSSAQIGRSCFGENERYMVILFTVEHATRFIIYSGAH